VQGWLLVPVLEHDSHDRAARRSVKEIRRSPIVE
jgi:hypothetical protein